MALMLFMCIAPLLVIPAGLGLHDSVCAVLRFADRCEAQIAREQCAYYVMRYARPEWGDR